MRKTSCSPFLKCGKTFDPTLPDQLSKQQPPITLAEVTVDPSSLVKPCVLVKFSEFIQFTLFGLRPTLIITYRLVRENRKSKRKEILDEWVFEFQATEEREFGNIITNQPTVLNVCDCLEEDRTDLLRYRLEIVEVVTNNVESYEIVDKNFTATVICGENEDW